MPEGQEWRQVLVVEDSRNWGYGPSGGLGLPVVIVLMRVLLRVI